MGLFSRSRTPSQRPPDVRPPGSVWWWVLPGAVLLGVAAWATVDWLLADLDRVPVTERVSARIEAARTALAAAAGVGAAVTLLLAVRRQRHQELATAHTTHDAAERRVTELYTKAAEQLGNAQAPVRLAGLYALERLAQDTPALRQTIVNVICAYLRMPYTQPREDRCERIRAAQRAARAGAATRSGAGSGRDPQEERQVRLAAQRILADHLRYIDPPTRRWWRVHRADPNLRHWPDIRLDLNGATLINLDLGNCRTNIADFGGATFTGPTNFSGATFTDAEFGEATFTSITLFVGAIFTGHAGFGAATFTDDVLFGEATFTGNADFGAATFNRVAMFDEATFTRHATFREATFTSNSVFHMATFNGFAVFHAAIFNRDADFGGATFTGNAAFRKATFTDGAWFSEATFTGNADFGAAIFNRDAEFDGATFTGNAGFSMATFSGGADFSEVTFTRLAGFAGATFTRIAGFGKATFTGNARFGKATFSNIADFGGATFTSGADFGVSRALEAADLHGARLAPVAAGVVRRWPSTWQAVKGADGWQTLRLAALPDDGQAATGKASSL